MAQRRSPPQVRLRRNVRRYAVDWTNAPDHNPNLTPTGEMENHSAVETGSQFAILVSVYSAKYTYTVTRIYGPPSIHEGSYTAPATLQVKTCLNVLHARTVTMLCLWNLHESLVCHSVHVAQNRPFKVPLTQKLHSDMQNIIVDEVLRAWNERPTAPELSTDELLVFVGPQAPQQQQQDQQDIEQ